MLERKELIKRREQYAGDSAAIVGRIRKMDIYAAAKRVMIYLPIKGEADVTELLCDDKEFFVPITRGGEIFAAAYSQDTIKGEFGVSVPKDAHIAAPETLDVVIVPGVAFDEAKNRIGYGKGCYDAFLIKTAAKRIGAAFDIQLFAAVPTHEGDVKMDAVVCETRVVD